MVHSNSSSPMKTAPSASPHQTDLTSSSDSSLTHTLTPADVKPPVLNTPTALSTNSSPASDELSTQTPTSSQGLINGRTSGRKRTPKACDCCGLNSAGHNVKTSSRGKGTSRGRGRGRGRGAVRDLGDNPKSKVGQLIAFKNFDLTKEDVQEAEDEDIAQKKLQTSVQVSNSRSQTTFTKTVQSTSQDGPIKNCISPKEGSLQNKQDVLMAQCGVADSVEKKDGDTKLLGQESRGTAAVRGRGSGPGKVMVASKTEFNIQIKSRGRGCVRSSRTGALGQSELVHKQGEKQDFQMDDGDQNNTGSVQYIFGNGDMVNLSDSDENMEDNTVITSEPADDLLVIPLQSSPTSRLGSPQDLDSDMQVDQILDQTDQVSLSLTLLNGSVPIPTDREHAASPVKVKTPAVASPPVPVTVSSTAHIRALRDHRLYCQPGTWVKHETEEMLIKNPSEEKGMDAEAQREETLEQLADSVHEFLESFYIKYGSFIPLSESDVLEHLKKEEGPDISSSGLDIKRQITQYRAGLASAPVAGFMVTHNKHTLSLEDLGTLEDQNWLNDQIINMYGELIMEATEQKVHFFNSFFHKQLVAKGYEGVKRWTKKVDLFSKWLLLIPIHLEIHWSLIAVTMATKTISYYDSQGIVFRHTTDNIMKYLQSEAREKKQAAFQKGWKITIIKGIPQQKNDSDCGVFVLEYCRCLSVKQPLLFSQDDMPRIRKRIYKELCDCHLND